MRATINVKDICGSGKVTREDGAVVNRRIREAWKSHDCIEIDFNNIRIASVSFLDEAVGLLALETDLDEVKEKLHLTNMSGFDQRLMDDILTSRARQRRRSGGVNRSTHRSGVTRARKPADRGKRATR